MARIVYITNGMASTLNSSLELNRRLIEAGHEVVYLSHVDLHRAVESHGCRFIQLQECQKIRDQLSVETETLKPIRSPANLIKRLRLGRAARKKSVSSDEIHSILREIDPDVLLIDFEMHYAILATRQMKIPTLLVAVWFSIFRSHGLPPMHTNIGPASDFFGHLKINMAWWKLIVKRLCEPLLEIKPRRLKRRFSPVSYGTNDRADLKAIARHQNVSLSSLTSRTNWSQPHTYRTIPMLSFNVREMELEHPVHPLLHYVGPMIQRNRLETKTSEDELRRWSEFQHRCDEEHRKIVYCSLGTFWSTDTNFLSKVIEAFRNQTDKSLVIGLGGKSTAEDFSPVPENVLAMQYAPQLEILKSAAVAITHGGITSINECICFEVPMLVCSTDYVDQPGCAVRLEHHKLGEKLDLKTSSSSAIIEKVNSLLNDEEIRNNVIKMNSVFQRYADSCTAEQAIESTIKGQLQSPMRDTR